MQVESISESFTCSWDPFPLTGLPRPDLMQGFGPSFILFVMSCCTDIIPGRPALFERKQRKVGLGEEEWKEGNCSQDILKKKKQKKQRKFKNKVRYEEWMHGALQAS